MKKILLISILFLFSSCICFKFQRMSWSHDPKSDTLKIFQEYEGISTTSGKVSARELGQYNNLMKSRNTYFFYNWIFEYPGLGLDNIVAGDIDITSTYPPQLHGKLGREFLLLMQKSVTVENGDFYENAAGELCGWQKVTFKNTSKIFELGNKLIRKFYEQEAKYKGNFYLAEPPEMKYIDIVNNQLIYRHPMKYDDYKKGKFETVKQILKTTPNFNPKTAAVFKLLQQDVQVNYKEPFLEVAAGKPGQKINVVESRAFMDNYKYNDALKKKVAEDHKIMPALDSAKKDSFFK